MSNEYLRGELQAALEHRINHGTSWLGVPARKQPIDAWVYQEIIFELRPDWIVEVGNRAGGSLLYLAHVCDLAGHGRVLGVDNNRDHFAMWVADHRRVMLVTGDALDVFPEVENALSGSALVIEDSAHTYDHTLAVLETYAALVQPGGYLICEDGMMPPVADAIAAFLAGHSEFEADESREWPLTWNPNGYLRRVA